MLLTTRFLAILEGISYLLLFALSMPLKYWADIREPNIYIGYVHGFLFISFIGITALLCSKQKWGTKTFLKFFVASLLPFGTFYMDQKYLKPLKAT